MIDVLLGIKITVFCNIYETFNREFENIKSKKIFKNLLGTSGPIGVIHISMNILYTVIFRFRL